MEKGNEILERLEPEEFERYLTEGISYTEGMEIMKQPKKRIRRKRSEITADVIWLKDNDNPYNRNVQVVLKKIKQLMEIDCVGINSKDTWQLKPRGIYIILNRRNVDISLKKTKELYKLVENK